MGICQLLPNLGRCVGKIKLGERVASGDGRKGRACVLHCAEAVVHRCLKPLLRISTTKKVASVL